MPFFGEINWGCGAQPLARGQRPPNPQPGVASLLGEPSPKPTPRPHFRQQGEKALYNDQTKGNTVRDGRFGAKCGHQCGRANCTRDPSARLAGARRPPANTHRLGRPIRRQPKHHDNHRKWYRFWCSAHLFCHVNSVRGNMCRGLERGELRGYPF